MSNIRVGKFMVFDIETETKLVELRKQKGGYCLAQNVRDMIKADHATMVKRSKSKSVLEKLAERKND